MSEWQPIETAPKDGRGALLYIPASEEMLVGFWSEDWGYWWVEDYIQVYPTHWVPLPPPPHPSTLGAL